MEFNYEVDFLVERPVDQRIWIVRASGGAYLSHFSEHNLIAIGHIDILNLPEGPFDVSIIDDLQKAFHKHDPERVKSSITSHVNQVRNFVAVIKQGDFVVSINPRRLRVGIVVGEAYIDKKLLSIARGEEIFEMKHSLRRAVNWGPRIDRKSVPAALEMSLLAHQTVFNIDDYWDSIYHLLYPCFYFDGRIYLSANIKQTRDLDNFSLAQFFALLSGVEIMAKEMEDDISYWQDYPEIPDSQLDQLDLNLTTKAEFMSPGAIWSTLTSSGASLLWVCVIYIMLFGGDIKIFKSEGIIDVKTRQKIWDRVLKLMEVHKFQKLKENLQIDIPKNDTKALESPKARKPRSGVEKAKIVKVDASSSSSQ